MPNANRTELKGINALEKVLLSSPLIVPDFDSNDKTVSWDGFVFFYREEKWEVRTLEGRIPVQIKSTENLFPGDTASYPMRTGDLRNYLTDGGAMLFLVSLDFAADKSYVFYASLSRELVKKILDAKPGQESVTISLQRFPEDRPEEMNGIFRAFIRERSMLAGSPQPAASTVTSGADWDGAKAGALLERMDEYLKDYVLEKFEWYKAHDVALQTPQLLLMLLTYPNDSIVIGNFDVYRTEDEEPYGSFLVKFFQSIDSQYIAQKRHYREQNWHSFLQLLEKAQEALEDAQRDSITVSILCYAVLKYSGGTTVQMIKSQMGDGEFERILRFLIRDAIPSVPIDPKRARHVVRCW